MDYKAIFCIVIFLMLTGCAAQEEPVSTRPPKTLITNSDYDDLEIKPPKKEPVEIDYKQGVTSRSIDTTKKIDAQEAIQEKFLYISSFGTVDELKTRYENGARVNFRNNKGETALIKVLEGPYDNQTLPKVEYLVSVGAQVDLKGMSARGHYATPLDCAVWKSSSVFKSGTASKSPFFAEQVIRYLIDEGADISGSDKNGDTPLHTASKSDNLFAAKFLLESGAEVMPKDYDGKTPLDYAKTRQMKTILLENGAVAEEGVTPEAPLPHKDIQEEEIEQGKKFQNF
jgi:ankyrin repeat protein